MIYDRRLITILAYNRRARVFYFFSKKQTNKQVNYIPFYFICQFSVINIAGDY